MTTPEQLNLGEAVPNFMAYENTLSGQVRYQVARRNLGPFVKGPLMQIIDVQGGSGPDTAWLAGLGHQVMLLEADEAQLRNAADRFYKLPPSASVRIISEQGDLQDMQGYHGAFGMALCHETAGQKSDPHSYLDQVISLVKPGGIVSILENGYMSEYIHKRQEGRSDAELNDFRKTRRFNNNLGQNVYAFTAQEMYDTLFNSGLEVLHWAGVSYLSVNANKPVSEFSDEEELKEIVKREYIFGNNKVFRAKGQMLHFIARLPQLEEEPLNQEPTLL